MTTVRDCWDEYVRTHIPTTIGTSANARYWGRLFWFQNLNPEASSFPMEVKAYLKTRKVAPGTVNRELAILRAALRHAEREGLISKSPIVRGLPKPPPRMRSLTREEAKAMIDGADRLKRWKERVYIRLALSTGQRPDAITGLTWDQVDFTNRVIDFRHVCEKSSRMKNRAIVPINDLAAKALAIAKLHEDGDYVINFAGSRLNHPRDMIKRIAKEAGIKDVSPHVLRHTVASLLLQDGVDLLKVSKLLGHSSTLITQQVYFQHPPSWLKETTNLLRY